jgi:hypothetical protein
VSVWWSQSKELTRGLPELVQDSFIGGVHIGVRALHVLNLIWLAMAKSLAYPSGEEVGNFIVLLIFTCPRYT